MDEAGKGSDRRDNFSAFNGGLYFWVKENNFTNAQTKCPSCGEDMYHRPDEWVMDTPPKNKLVCRCGHIEWRTK